MSREQGCRHAAPQTNARDGRGHGGWALTRRAQSRAGRCRCLRAKTARPPLATAVCARAHIKTVSFSSQIPRTETPPPTLQVMSRTGLRPASFLCGRKRPLATPQSLVSAVVRGTSCAGEGGSGTEQQGVCMCVCVSDGVDGIQFTNHEPRDDSGAGQRRIEARARDSRRRWTLHRQRRVGAHVPDTIPDGDSRIWRFE